MNRILLFLPIFALFLLFSVQSQADVFVEDVRANNRFNSGPPFTTGTIQSGSGNVEPGDYELIVCATVEPNGPNPFSPPSPNGWVERDNGSCGVFSSCSHGIWGRFPDSSSSEEITCSWQSATSVFASGSFRYAGVDQEQPIIGFIACANGSSDMPTAPSINTEAGSQVAFIWTYTAIVPSVGSPQIFTDPNPVDPPNVDAVFFADAFNTFSFIATQGQTEFFDTAGPTGNRPLTVDFEVTSWRACTIGLRMGTAPPPVSQAVPTMSEWGLISFAAFAGIAGLWYLRRRQATV